MAPDSTTSLEALGIAIRAELDASELYAELAERAGNSMIRDKLLLLSKEERQHKRILEATYNRQFRDVPLELPRSQFPPEISCKALRAGRSAKQLLACAIDQERRSREFYLAEAEKTDDLSGKRMFNFLADLEFSHQMELSAEYDLMTRFPRYFEQALEPWKPEFRS